MSNEKQRFFNFMSDQHGLTLTDSEMHEIAKEAALYLAGNDADTKKNERRPFLRDEKVIDSTDGYGKGIVDFSGKDYIAVKFENGAWRAYEHDGRRYSRSTQYQYPKTLFHID